MKNLIKKRHCRSVLNISTVLLVAALFYGCARKPPEWIPPDETVKIGKPYTINHTTYYPIKTARGYREKGVASWYGKPFHGRPTANGERYDMHAMTAAHTTLPLPTYVRVTHLKNGRHVIVRVNDRGPFVKNRLIDLSRKAAEKLDMLRSGTAPVLVESLSAPDAGADSLRKMTPVVDAEIFVQAGAFLERENAKRLADRLEQFGAVQIYRSPLVRNQRFYRVQLGPILTVKRADQMVERLAREGFKTVHIVVK